MLGTSVATPGLPRRYHSPTCALCHRMPNRPATNDKTRLRAAPSFVQALSMDGRPYVAKETEPYTQYWLSERERVLLSLFSARYGSTVQAATAAYFRLTDTTDSAAERQRLDHAIHGLQAAGVLMRPGQDTSRYSAAIVADYVAHRPFPRGVAAHIVARAGITRGSRVLDLAGGPGDLALALAQASDQVSLMELSRGFLAAARRRARAAGVSLTPIHDTCNRLVFRDDRFDVVTVSQALHWLDDVQVCRGLCRVLSERGHFFVVHSAIDLDPSHPLAYLLGHHSILGHKKRQSFVAELKPLQRRLSLLFEALDAPEVQRIDPTQPRLGVGATSQTIVAASVSLFTQTRPFDEGYARGFLTPQHIAATGQSPAKFWADLQARCAAAQPEELLGQHHWGVLHFQRGAVAGTAASLDHCGAETVALA
jgi:2-polyprenyl-3-methyl-5-hydroxy-6-metoxy-1,4-benzoquinol methylase